MTGKKFPCYLWIIQRAFVAIGLAPKLGPQSFVFPRTFKTTQGYYLGRNAALRLLKRGKARISADGRTLEIIESLSPAELDRQLASIPPKPRHRAIFSRLLHHANCQDPHWVDLRPAIPVSPEWLQDMGYSRKAILSTELA